ncbi:MAG: hypothetical protein L0Z62_25730, partial [Gemmataceae bacterium]|nr:hypothetical protein [Gemmataceae bacterium]
AAPVAALLSLNIVKAATCVAAGKTLEAGLLSPRVLTLAEEAMTSMTGIKGRLVLLLALSLTVGAGLAGYAAWVEQPSDEKQPAVAQPDPPKPVAADPLPAGALVQIGQVGQDRWLHGVRADFAAFLPDGKTVLTVNFDLTIRLWEFPSGKEIRRFRLPARAQQFRGHFVAAALSKDGKTLASHVGGEEVYLHDVASGKELPPRINLNLNLNLGGGLLGGIGGGLPPPGFLAFSPDGQQLACLESGPYTIWDLRKAKMLARVGPEAGAFGGFPGGGVRNPRPHSLLYAPDGKSLATFHDKEVKLWDTATWTEMRTVEGMALRGLPAFSPDSRTLAVPTGSSVTLVEAATGTVIDKLGTEKKEVELLAVAFSSAVAFSKDGTKLYVTEPSATVPGAGVPALPGGAPGGGTVVTRSELLEWDLASRKVLRRCPGAVGGPMALSPDGNTLVVAGLEPRFVALGGKDITAINKTAGNKTADHEPAPPLVWLGFPPDGKTLLTGTGTGWGFRPHDLGAVQCWDARTGRKISDVSFRLTGPWGDATSLSPNGKVGAVVREPTGEKPWTIVLFDAASAKEFGRIPLQEGGRDVSMCFAPDSNTLAISQPEKQKLELYDVATAKLLRTLDAVPGHDGFYPHPMVFSADGKTLAWYDNCRTLLLLDTTTGKRIGGLGGLPFAAPKQLFGGFGGFGGWYGGGMPMEPESNRRFAFSPDGRCLAVDMEDGTVVLYELAAGRQPRSTFGTMVAPGLRFGFAFSRDGKSLAQGGPDGIVRLWDVLTGKEMAAFKGHTDGVNAVAFSPDGKRLASASDDSTALIWDVSKIARPALPAAALKPGDLERHWQTLAEPNGEKAWDAIRALTAAPRDAVAWIQERVKPARQADPRGKPTGLLLQGELLRAYRAVEVLERIGTAQARTVLQTLAGGAPGALLTTSAQAALKR